MTDIYLNGQRKQFTKVFFSVHTIPGKFFLVSRDVDDKMPIKYVFKRYPEPRTFTKDFDNGFQVQALRKLKS